jgi:hypothetical protein
MPFAAWPINAWKSFFSLEAHKTLPPSISSPGKFIEKSHKHHETLPRPAFLFFLYQLFPGTNFIQK